MFEKSNTSRLLKYVGKISEEDVPIIVKMRSIL